MITQFEYYIMCIYQNITWHPVSMYAFVFVYHLNLIVKMKKVQIPVTDYSDIMKGPWLDVCHDWFVCMLFFSCCGTRLEK